ncbi:MAG: hypothetical protein HRU15_07635 [Planctomycetes bacterium]|nr:hypothetical protein [Planctomycetota bacterium]
MAGEDKARKFSVFLGLVVAGVLFWQIAPMFLPIYKWTKVDFKKIAEKTGKPQAELEKVFSIKMRFNPRGSDDRDPAGWEILEMSPEWIDADTEAWPKEDEYKLTVRCKLISDRTGGRPSDFMVGKFYYDRYFSCKAQRLPPGALGQTSPRPILLYDAGTLQALDRGEVLNYHNNPDDWSDHDEVDGSYDDYWEGEIIPEEVPDELDEAASE